MRGPGPLVQRVPSELHLSADGRCRLLSLIVTAGQRADCIALTNQRDRGRIPRAQVQLRLLQAFASEEDTTVFNAVLKCMKREEKQQKKRRAPIAAQSAGSSGHSRWPGLRPVRNALAAQGSYLGTADAETARRGCAKQCSGHRQHRVAVG